MNRQSQILVFLLDDRQYGLWLGQVQRVIRAVDAAPLPEGPEIVLGIIDVAGQIVPLFDIRRRFGIDCRAVEPADHFIIARAGGRTVALCVDNVRGIVGCPAGRVVDGQDILQPLDLVAGAVQFPDGLVLIHDLEKFLSPGEQQAMEQAIGAIPA